MQKISLNLFDFELDENLIAQKPLENKLEAKMLVVKEQDLLDYKVANLLDVIQSGDLIIFNNTKVIPAKLRGFKGESKILINLHMAIQDKIWLCFIKNSKRLKQNDVIILDNLDDKIGDGSDFKAIVLEKLASGEVKLEFICDNLVAKLNKYGEMPLPPYIKRGQKNQEDNTAYQSIFAKKEGAIASPTASLHFNNDLLEALKNKGVNFAYITLHVGAGTFMPVKVDNILEHKIHSEYGELEQKTIDMIIKTKQNGGAVIAVGTTTLRVLEYWSSSLNNHGDANSNLADLKPYFGNVDIFIYQSFKFRVVDKLLTNFHLPKSTLFMLTCAFAGYNVMKKAYHHAIKHKYRFFSYGDCCFLSLNKNAENLEYLDKISQDRENI
jgi:S-adenosylmethionine:tRNA ribosyltransferase-isomerase